MAYEKFHEAWEDLPSQVTPITAEALDHIEAGIATAQAAAEGGEDISDGDKGDITISGSGTVWTIDDGAVTAAKVAADVATQAELDAEAALARNGDNITSGTVADARIASTIARDSEVAAAYQPLDADLTDIAAIADAQGDMIVRGASGWERLAKSATSTHVLTAGASQPSWAAGVSWPLDNTGATAATDAITLDVTGDTQLRFVVDHDGTMWKGPGSVAPSRFLWSEYGAGIGTGAGAPGSTHVGALAGLVDTSQFATSLGAEALMSNTTGLYNTAIGGRVLRALIDGDYNTAVGMDTAQRITTGNNNVAMGVSAMSYVTTTSDNVAIGWKALQQNTGYQNVAIGSSANLSAGAAYSNVIVGAAAGGTITSGPLNVIIGQGAAAGLTAQGANVVVGQGAYAAGTAGYNTVVGWEAMAAVVTGEENIAIGRRALTRPGGTLANATTSGAFNVAVGDETGQAGTTARSNMTLLGYRALGDGTYATALGSTASAGAAGAVAIGTDSSGAGASTTTANEIKVGTANHTLTVIGNASIGGAAKTVGFYGSAGVAKQTGVAVTAGAIHAALVALNLIAA